MIFISLLMQEMDKDVIHIYVTIALFCLSFVMISISLVIFFKFRYVHWKCCYCALHEKNVCVGFWYAFLIFEECTHTHTKPNGCKSFKFNCKNLSLISKYLCKLKIKLLKLSAKMNLKYTSMQISINFCLKYFFIFCLICKNEKQFFLNLYKK